MKAYLIIESRGEDYHGQYNDVIAVYADIEDAKEKIMELEENNLNYNIDYHIDTWNVITKKGE